eukprot:g50207.t1
MKNTEIIQKTRYKNKAPSSSELLLRQLFAGFLTVFPGFRNRIASMLAPFACDPQSTQGEYDFAWLIFPVIFFISVLPILVLTAVDKVGDMFGLELCRCRLRFIRARAHFPPPFACAMDNLLNIAEHPLIERMAGKIGPSIRCLIVSHANPDSIQHMIWDYMDDFVDPLDALEVVWLETRAQCKAQLTYIEPDSDSPRVALRFLRTGDELDYDCSDVHVAQVEGSLLRAHLLLLRRIDSVLALRAGLPENLRFVGRWKGSQTLACFSPSPLPLPNLWELRRRYWAMHYRQWPFLLLLNSVVARGASAAVTHAAAVLIWQANFTDDIQVPLAIVSCIMVLWLFADSLIRVMFCPRAFQNSSQYEFAVFLGPALAFFATLLSLTLRHKALAMSKPFACVLDPLTMTPSVEFCLDIYSGHDMPCGCQYFAAQSLTSSCCAAGPDLNAECSALWLDAAVFDEAVTLLHTAANLCYAVVVLEFLIFWVLPPNLRVGHPALYLYLWVEKVSARMNFTANEPDHLQYEPDRPPDPPRVEIVGQ